MLRIIQVQWGGDAMASSCGRPFPFLLHPMRFRVLRGYCRRPNTGTNTILATNTLLEATVTVPAANTQRFFQVIEAD